MANEGQDALANQRPSSSLIPAGVPDRNAIVYGNDATSRRAIADALEAIAKAFNSYVTRKGV